MGMHGVERGFSDGYPLQTPPVGKLLDILRMLACMEVKISMLLSWSKTTVPLWFVWGGFIWMN